MKLAIKFTLIFLLIGLFAGVIYATLGYDSLEDEINEHLLEVLDEREKLVENFLSRQKERAVLISKEDVIRNFLENLNQREALLDEVNNVFLYEIANDEFIDELFILSPQGDILVNTQKGYTPPEIFKEFDYSIEKEGQAYVKPIRFCYCITKYVLDVTVPLYDEVTGNLIGLIATRVHVAGLADLVGGQVALSHLERVYLVDRTGLLVSSSILFQESQRDFIQNTDNENSRKCFNQRGEEDYVTHEEFAEPFLNYLGEKVVGVHKYFSELEWCLLIEDDVTEVYDIPKRNALIRDVLVIFALIVILSMIGYIFGKYLDIKRGKDET